MKTPMRQTANEVLRGRNPLPRWQTVLAAWRGIDTSEAESLQGYQPKNVATLTKHLIADLNLQQKECETEIPRVWASAIDPRITAHAQPTGLKNGTLFVTVDHNTWLHEILRYHRKEILNRLQNSFGKSTIQRISFRLG